MQTFELPYFRGSMADTIRACPEASPNGCLYRRPSWQPPCCGLVSGRVGRSSVFFALTHASTLSPYPPSFYFLFAKIEHNNKGETLVAVKLHMSLQTQLVAKYNGGLQMNNHCAIVPPLPKKLPENVPKKKQNSGKSNIQKQELQILESANRKSAGEQNGIGRHLRGDGVLRAQ
jgi:hypothetical protein